MVLLLAIASVPIAVEKGGLGILARIFYMAIFWFGGYLLIGGGKWTIAYVVIAVPALVAGILHVTPNETPVATFLNNILQAILQGFLIFAVFRFSLTSSTASKGDRILAGICGYIILGFFWAQIYSLTPVFFDDGFRHPDGVGTLPDDGSTLYFSLVTLTTLGYGDISPANPWTRMLATLQAISGTLYVAVFISAIVSLPHDVGKKGEENS